MSMDLSSLSSCSSDGSQFSSMNLSPREASSIVLSIECLKEGSKGEEWTDDKLQSGDIVEEIRIGNLVMTSQFKNGKIGVQKILRNSFEQKETSIQVRVRRSSKEFAEMQACIVPLSSNNLMGKKRQYVLRAINDPNYIVGFCDRSESECYRLQDSRISRMTSTLEKTPLQDGYASYPWEKSTQEMLSIPCSSSFYSILFFPKVFDKVASRYNDLEDTLARAQAWISASQALGVPILFTNIQTESLLTKISGDTASSTVNAGSLSDLSNLANTSLYGFEDYHGVDIGVVRAVRMWFSPQAGEIPVQIKIKDTDTKLGFAISRTAEGFIFISSVIEGNDDFPSTRSGISKLFKQAYQTSRLLIVSRIGNQKVLPWLVTQTGAIRCYDTVSLSQKLSLHRHAKIPILLHLFSWDVSLNFVNVDSSRSQEVFTIPSEVSSARHSNENQVPFPPGEGSSGESSVHDEHDDHDGHDDIMLEKNMEGQFSFRLHDLTLKSNWV